MKTFKQYLSELKKPRWEVPAEPGSTPTPEGKIKLYHQTSMKNLNAIRRQGIQLSKAKGYEGPKAIYASPPSKTNKGISMALRKLTAKAKVPVTEGWYGSDTDKKGNQVTNIDMKGGKPLTPGDWGKLAVAKALYGKVTTRYRSKARKLGGTKDPQSYVRRGDAQGAAIYGFGKGGAVYRGQRIVQPTAKEIEAVRANPKPKFKVKAISQRVDENQDIKRTMKIWGKTFFPEKKPKMVMVVLKKPKTEKGQKEKAGGGGVFKIPRYKFDPKKHQEVSE